MIPDTPDEVAAPLLQPPIVGAITETYIMNNTLFCTPEGHIYRTPGKVLHDNPAKNTDAFERFREQIGWEGFDNFCKLERKKWMLIHFQGNEATADIVYDILVGCCDIVGIGSSNGNCTAMIRRKSQAKPVLNGVMVLKIYIPQLNGRRNSDDIMFDCLRAWNQAQDKIMTNFAIYLPEVSAESILSEWAARSPEEVQLDIINARSTANGARTPRQHFIFGQHVQLQNLRRCRAEARDVSVLKASDINVLALQIFQPPPSMLMCWRRDSVSGCMETFSIKQFIFDGSGPKDRMEHLL